VLLAALLLSTGKIADTWGRKRAFLIGLTIFVAGSVLAGFSTSAATLISACAVQEIGAAFIMSSVLSTVNAVFRGKYRAAAFGVRSAVISGEAAVGPLAGGARDFGCGVRAVYPAEKHRERGHLSALLDLGLFSYSTFSWGNITAGAIAIGQFAIIFVLPLYLINALDLSTMLAGLVLAAMAIGAFFSGAAAPPRRGTVRGAWHRAHRARLGSRRRPYLRPAYGAGYEWLDHRRTADPVRLGPGVRLRNAKHRAPDWGSGAGLKRRHDQRHAVVARRRYRVPRVGLCLCTSGAPCCGGEVCPRKQCRSRCPR